MLADELIYKKENFTKRNIFTKKNTILFLNFFQKVLLQELQRRVGNGLYLQGWHVKLCRNPWHNFNHSLYFLKLDIRPENESGLYF